MKHKLHWQISDGTLNASCSCFWSRSIRLRSELRLGDARDLLEDAFDYHVAEAKEAEMHGQALVAALDELR